MNTVSAMPYPSASSSPWDVPYWPKGGKAWGKGEKGGKPWGKGESAWGKGEWSKGFGKGNEF